MAKLPRVEVKSSAAGCEVDVFFAYQDGKSTNAPGATAYRGLLDRLSKNKVFDGAKKSVSFQGNAGKGGRVSVCFVGLGKREDLKPETARVAGSNAWKKFGNEKVSSIALNVDAVDVNIAQAFLEGMWLSAYSYTAHKTKASLPKTEPKSVTKVVLVSKDKKGFDAASRRALELADAVTLCRDWSNEPSNFGTPEYYAAQCMKVAKTFGVKCRVIGEAEAKRMKLNLFLSVGAGSDRESKMVVLEYTPKGIKSPKTVALVGKGVTFDTGGISIKPGLRMEDMKHDMTGAATLAAATFLAAKRKVKCRIVTVLAFAENMPSGNATTPGNVITARNGKTVEIVNTDAEGRLVLGDALDLAQDYKPDLMINAATLTGACSVALGRQACAILGNDQELIDELVKAGAKNGERMWQLPLWDEYFDDLKSDYADMRNVANDSNGGTIRGGKFLQQFVKDSVRWAHLDIANVAYDNGHVAYHPRRGASGIYIRTLADFLENGV